MKIEEVIGRRIREAREYENLSQEDVGRAMARYLEKPWPNQQVSVAEDGGRKFTAAELFALCMVLRRPASYLFLPDPDDIIEVPGSEKRIDDDAFLIQLVGPHDGGIIVPAVQAIVGPLASELAGMEAVARQARETVEQLGRALAEPDQGEAELPELPAKMGVSRNDIHEPTAGERSSGTKVAPVRRGRPKSPKGKQKRSPR
jgi:transcriptional regulator with XRE-family HTH domain